MGLMKMKTKRMKMKMIPNLRSHLQIRKMHLTAEEGARGKENVQGICPITVTTRKLGRNKVDSRRKGTRWIEDGRG
jgi:hypothetical protein